MILIYFLLPFIVATQEKPTVQTTLGKLEGHIIKSYGGRSVDAFEGIPYAKPPLGELRFQDPRPSEPWLGKWKATAPGPNCLQNEFVRGSIVGNEDCLYLNVYVPSATNASSKLDVIVHIHGGAFTFGSSEIAGPKLLMDRDVVYVNLNYRLGLFGFLSTESRVISGNQGLKDQQLALRWVRKNIAKFGGNPHSVTLTGLSAGGGSSHLHFFSKKSRGLFHKAISHSGTALGPWIIQEGALEKTRKLAFLIGCDEEDMDNTLKCIQKRPAEQIIVASKQLYSNVPGFPLVLFGPVIEPHSQNAFLDEYPYCALKNGKINNVPWLASVTSDEGILGIMMFNGKFDKIEQVWNDSAQHLMVYNYTCPELEKASLANKIKRFYLGEQEFSERTSRAVIDVFGDRYFYHSLEKATRLQAKAISSPIYVYRFDYKSSLARKFDQIMNLDSNFGVNHGEDCELIYNVNYKGFPTVENLTKEDEDMKNLMIDIVTSFAKDGTPKINEVNWKPVDGLEYFNFLDINGPDNVELVSLSELSHTKFWDELPILENEKIEKEFCRK